MPNQPTDPTPYLFLAAMIVIGGLVAWVADGMGRKVGKKRLSFLGLRPRHTATLLTVGAGVLIPILTIAVIYASSRDVRDWIREGRGALDRAREYQKIADGYREDILLQEQKAKEMQDKNSKLTQQAESLNKKLTQFENQVDQASQRRDQAERLAKTAQAKAAGLQGKLTLTTKQIDAKEKEIIGTQKELQARRQEYSRLQTTLATASGDLTDIKKQALELDRQNVDLEKKLGTLQSDLSELQTQKKGYESQIDSYKESVQTYEGTIQDYNEKINQLSQKAGELDQYLRQNLQSSRIRPMIFEANEEVTRIQIPPSLSPVAARNAYLDLLARARTAAASRKSDSVNPIVLAERISKDGRRISVREQEELLIRDITSKRDEFVVVAIAPLNAFEGERVLLDFLTIQNRLVYPQNKLIVEKRLDGRKPEADILNQIQDFISTNVRAKALRDGMIPPFGRNGQLGSIKEEELLELIHEIKSQNQLVRLQALAESDTKAGDQLNLIFRVRL